MSKEIKGTIYKLTYTATWHEFVECSSKTELFEYVARQKLAGYGITSVVEICKDGRTPKVAVLSDKEYKQIYNRLKKEKENLSNFEEESGYVYVCYEVNYNEICYENETVQALCVKDSFDKATQFLTEQIKSGVDNGFVEEDEAHYVTTEEIKSEIAKTGKYAHTMYRGYAYNDDESYCIVIERQKVE